MQGHGVGQSPNVPGDHRHRAEFAHGSGVAEQDPVHEAPANIGQGDAPKGLPASGTERQRGFLIVLALRLHHGNEFTRNERERDENGRKHDARYREYHPDVVSPEIAAEPAVRTEEQNEDESGNDRRHRER